MTDTDRNLPPQAQNAEKDPSQWVTGGEPMTGPQASYLETLLQQAGRADEFDPEMTKAQASEMIDQLQQETGRGQGTSDGSFATDADQDPGGDNDLDTAQDPVQ